MDKTNVFRSSSFFMEEGDILHILIKDELGTPIEIDLTNATTNNPEDAWANMDMLFAGTSTHDLILKSVNGGETFMNMLSEDLGKPTCFCQLNNDDILYGTDEGYVVNYTQRTSIFVASLSIIAIACNGANVICVEGMGVSHLFYSNDYGLTFTIGASLFSTAVDLVNIGVDLYVCTTDKYIYRVHADGTLYAAPPTALTYYSVCYAGGVTVYVGGTDGHIWRSLDSGATWTDIGDKVGSAVTISDIKLLGGGRIGYVAGGDFYYTDNGFTTYFQTYVGDANKLVKYTDLICLLGTNVGGKIVRSIDNGVTWAEILDNPQYDEDEITCLITAVQ